MPVTPAGSLGNNGGDFTQSMGGASASEGSAAKPGSNGPALPDIGDSIGVFGARTDPERVVDQLDLLFVIDNSISMADKQEALAQIVPRLVRDMVNPRCVDTMGVAVVSQPDQASSPCPPNSGRAMRAIRDLHVGVLSSSLGGHGSSSCDPKQRGAENATQDDRGELIGARRNSGAPGGYLSWSGVGEIAEFESAVAALIQTVGETGCSFEATNEAWYRFLVDPSPPAEVVAVESSGNRKQTVRQGINQTILTQRAAFLRPQSSVMVVVLSDENDCSVRDDGYSWLVGDSSRRMPKSRSVCSTAPNDPCCGACSDVAVTSSCGEDPACASYSWEALEDPLALRCMDQKKRFGIDLLYPVDRYVEGLSSPTVTDASGALVPNPLYAGGRDPSLVSYVPIVGVPWQSLAKSADPTIALEFKTAEDLDKENMWPALVGDVDAGLPPLDPFMQESVDPREGTSPLFGGTIQPPTAGFFASPANGHEVMPSRNRGDLQYACVYPLATPRPCGTYQEPPAGGCDCVLQADSTLFQTSDPLCQAPDGSYGNIQYFAKAFPGIRHLEIARRLGKMARPASICPRTLDLNQPDGGYGPVLKGIRNRLEEIFTQIT